MARNLFATEPTAAPTEQQAAPAEGGRKPVNLLAPDPFTQSAGGKTSLPEGTLESARQKELQKDWSGWNSAGYGLGDALTFGFGDEGAGVIEGVVRGVQDPANFTKKFSEGYSEVTDRVRKKMEDAYDANPGSYIGGSIAGIVPSLGGGLLVRGGTAAAAKGIGSLGSGIKGAALQGGVYGVGSGTDIESRLAGGAAGAVTGAAVGMIPGAVGAVYRSGKKVAQGTADTIGGLVNPASRAEKVVARALKADSDIASQTGKRLLNRSDVGGAAARGQDVLLGDMGDEVTGRLARAAANASPEAGAILRQTLDQRFKGQTDRVVGNIDNMYGGLNSADELDIIKKAAQQTVTPAYQRAMNDPRAQQLYDSKLEGLMQSPAVQRAIDGAEERSRELAVEMGSAPIKSPFKRDANGSFVLDQSTGATPSLAFWDIVKRGLDKEVTAAYKAGDASLARSIKANRDQLREHLENSVPTYAFAKGLAAQFFKVEDAFEAGQKFATTTKEAGISDARRMLDELRRDPNRAAEAELFERGYMTALMGKMSSIRDGRDLTKVLFGSKAEKEKFAAAVPDAVKRREIEAMMRVEEAMQALNVRVSGGSNTAQNLLDIGLGGAGAFEAAQFGLNPTSPFQMLAAARGVQKFSRNKTLNEVAKLMTSGAPQDIQRVSQMAARDPKVMSFIESVGRKVGAGTREIAAPVAGIYAADEAAAASDEPGFKFGGAVKALSGAAKKAKSAPKPKLEGEALIDDWKWRPQEEVAAELGLQDQPIPDHVQAFGRYMKEMSDKAGGQGLSKRDMIKAFGITRASIQRRAQKADKLREGGFDIPNAGESVRPEGAMAEWFFTPAGQRYLDNAEKGVIDEEAITDFQAKFKPFGKAEQDVPDFMRGAVTTFDDDYVRQLSDLVARGARGESTPDEWRAATERLRGIGPAKKGFIASLLGRGDQPTPDARQLVLQTGRPSKEASSYMARRGGKGGDAAVERLTKRQRDLNMKLPAELDPYYQHLTHHTIWDKVAGEKTTHEDIIRAMRLAAQAGAIPMSALALYERNLEEGQGFSKGGIIKATFADMMRMAGITDEKQMAAIADRYQNVKSKRPAIDWEMEYIDNSASKLTPERGINPEDLQGSILTQMTGDRSNGAINVMSVNGKNVGGKDGVDLQAGRKFARRTGAENPDNSIWASDGKVVKGYQKRAKKAADGFEYFDGSKAQGDVYGIFNPMSEGAVDFSTMPTEILLPQIDRKSNSLAEAFDALDERVRSWEKNKKGVGRARDFVGIRDERAADQLLGRMKIDDQKSTPSNMRKALLWALDNANMRKAGLPDVGPARWAVTDPGLLTAREGDMGSVIAKIDPSRSRITNPKYKHRSYPEHVGGEYVGGFEEAIPRQVLFPDWHDNFMRTKGEAQRAKGTKEHLIEGGMRNSFAWSDDVFQRADQKWLDGVMSYLERVKRLREQGE